MRWHRSGIGRLSPPGNEDAMTRVPRLLACIAGLSALPWAVNVRAEDTPAGTGQVLQLPLPQGFPLPYAHVKLTPRNDEEAAYLDYLRTTQVFPDEGVCTRELKRRGDGKIRRDSLQIDWVTPPFLAWGGKLGGDAIVGPIEHLYAITEAHLTYELPDGTTKQGTFACFAQYAGFRESAIWRAGHVKYGAYTNAGHGKYTSGPALLFTHAPSGTPTTWEPGIRYLRK
jgi:hypothetical protein